MSPQHEKDLESSATGGAGNLYPQCPVCGKFKTLHKVGNVYVCRSCHRLTRVFNWGKPKNARH